MSQDTIRTDSGTSSGETALPRRFTSRPATEAAVDQELVDQTRSQIRSLIQEIADLAKADVGADAFYEGFLVRTTSALASVGGALWLRSAPDRPFELKYQINLAQTPLAQDDAARRQHAQLLQRIAERNEATIVPPHSGPGDDSDVVNPTDLLLLFGPLVVDGRLTGLVEILQRPGGGPATQRGYLRFLTQMSELASDFIRNEALRGFTREQQAWVDLEQFARRIHEGLDPGRTSFTVANEGRRLLGCDRVSVAIRRGSGVEVRAVSGLDSIERRADQVKRLAGLASAVLRAGQPVWYEGDAAGLPPQIEERLQQYVDRSQSRMVAVLPLHQKPVDELAGSGLAGAGVKPARSRPIVVGALILESLGNSRVTPAFRERAAVVGQHAGVALGNALEHDGIFLMPLWKTLGWMARPFSASRWPKTAAVLACLAAALVMLWITPWRFTLGAEGQLIAESQREIYARVAGTLVEVTAPADPQMVVAAGTVLATLVNNELLQEIETTEGRVAVSREQFQKLNRAYGVENDAKNKIQLAGDLAAEQQNQYSLEQELKLLRARAADLQVTAPIEGRIANWQLRRHLLGRPVEVGQNLMTIVAPDTTWQVELFVPEKRVGHLLARMENSRDPVPVSFTLASRPGLQLHGRLVSVDKVLDVHDDQGNTARVLVEFDNADLGNDLRRSGTRAMGRLECGQRPLGYVLFRELIETVHSTWQFWW